MKTRYKYINFAKVSETPKTSVWACNNNSSGDLLGRVGWYPGWRQYCFLPTPETIFSTGCMEDICDFIKQLHDERKGVTA